jgi:hypothetical protein
MKLMNCLFAAAALTAVAVSAPAQTLKADIPFTFHAGSKVMSPGEYQVKLEQGAGNPVFVVRNADSGQVSVLLVRTTSNAAKAWREDGKPRLRFDCAGTRCVLREVYTGMDSSQAFHVPGPKLAGDEPTYTSEIGLSKVKAD